MSAQSIGLADEYAVITGIDAGHANPAVSNADDYKFSIEFNASGDFCNNLLVNDYMDDSYKEIVLNKAGNNGFLLANKIDLGIRLQLGFLTAFVDGRSNGITKLSPDLAALLLKGNEIEKEYDFNGTGGALSFYADTGFNLSFEMPGFAKVLKAKEVYIGAAYHNLTGVIAKTTANGSVLVDFEDNTPSISANNSQFVLQYNDVEDANYASGQSFDMGLYLKKDDKISWGVSVLNLAGSLSADSYRQYKYELVYDEIEEQWDIKEEEDRLINDSLNYKLPLVIKLSSSMSYTDNLSLYTGYTMTNYNDQVFINGLTDHKFALGVEYSRLRFLPLRVGINYSTLQQNFAINTGLGLHLGPVKADLGFSDLTGLFYKSKGVAVGVNFGLKF
ncbi:MAG: hypothetical protein ACOCRU_01795 [bacterium]